MSLAAVCASSTDTSAPTWTDGRTDGRIRSACIRGADKWMDGWVSTLRLTNKREREPH